jgi:hypothetical protein
MAQQLLIYHKVRADKKIKAFYTLLKEDIEQSMLEYTPELKTELDSRFSAYKNSKSRMISFVESKKRIRKILSAGAI